MRGGGRWFRGIAYPGQRSRRGRGSLLLVGNPHTRKVAEGHSIDHGCHLSGIPAVSHNKNTVTRNRGHEPQILMGASSSNRIGWFMKISRAFVQRYLISYSCSCTGLPGRFPRTVKKREKKDTDQYSCSKTRAWFGRGMRWSCSTDTYSILGEEFAPTRARTSQHCRMARW